MRYRLVNPPFKALCTLLLVVISYSLFAQKPGHVWPAGEAGKDYNVVDADGKRQGTWVRVYGNNAKALLYRGQFKNGEPEGVWDWYYPTGELMTKMTHIKGEIITENVNYYEDGKTVMSEGRFEVKTIDGKAKRCREGKWLLYSRAGAVLAEENYTDSILNGPAKYFYQSGKLIGVYPFVMGVRNGPCTEFYESGKKMRECTYLADVFDGAYTSWNENGTKDMEGKYVKGVKDGAWRYYTNKGLVETSVQYNLGKEVKKKFHNGTFKSYYDSGIPKDEFTYSNDLLDGPFTEWYDIGTFVQIPTSKEDQQIGVMYREKLEGTQVKRQGDYADGKLEGEVIYYLESGRVEKVEIYEDGVLIETRK